MSAAVVNNDKSPYLQQTEVVLRLPYAYLPAQLRPVHWQGPQTGQLSKSCTEGEGARGQTAKITNVKEL